MEVSVIYKTGWTAAAGFVSATLQLKKNASYKPHVIKRNYFLYHINNQKISQLQCAIAIMKVFHVYSPKHQAIIRLHNNINGQTM